MNNELPPYIEARTVKSEAIDFGTGASTTRRWWSVGH
jgi:hypothetical protein